MNDSITNMRADPPSRRRNGSIPRLRRPRAEEEWVGGASEGTSAAPGVLRHRWSVGTCPAEEASGPAGRLHLSISASSLDAGRNTSESSRACSCWPPCLLLWKRPRRPIWVGWSGSAGRGPWSPGSGRCRAGCRLASGAS